MLRVVAARFVREGRDLLAPFSLELGAGERARLVQPDALGARVAARLAAGIVKPTFGAVTIGDFDSRLQPAQAKRLVGFVPHGGFRGSERAFAREIGFRADVWNVDVGAMTRAAGEILTALRTVPLSATADAYARAMALALAPGVRLAVLELPPEGAIEMVATLRPGVAAVCTSIATDRPVAAPGVLVRRAP